MTDNTKVVEGLSSDNAVLLLEAAQKLDLPADVVRTTSDGFEVPEDVFYKAGFKDSDEDGDSDELDFSSKAEAEKYAEDNNLDVDKSLNAADYKAAVSAAAKEQDNG